MNTFDSDFEIAERVMDSLSDAERRSQKFPCMFPGQKGTLEWASMVGAVNLFLLSKRMRGGEFLP